MKKKLTQRQIDKRLASLAEKHLRIETLEARGRDFLDFHEVFVGSLQALLQDVFEEGFEAGHRNDNPTEMRKHFPGLMNEMDKRREQEEAR